MVLSFLNAVHQDPERAAAADAPLTVRSVSMAQLTAQVLPRVLAVPPPKQRQSKRKQQQQLLSSSMSTAESKLMAENQAALSDEMLQSVMIIREELHQRKNQAVAAGGHMTASGLSGCCYSPGSGAMWQELLCPTQLPHLELDVQLE
jgi:hypothetical protein